MAHLNLTGFGQEFDKYEYKNGLDWFVRYNDISNLWKAQPTYILAQAAFLLGGLLTFVHALSKGGRWPWLWLATIFHGLVVEMLSYFMPDIDSFWHSQTPLIFLGGRLPIHIISLYPVFIYHAVHAVSKLQLPKWAEPFAVGLAVILIDIPYDIVSVKFVHWIWHDTDPNIFDRHYWVPWNSYYFHATFAASFTFWFHNIPNVLDKAKEKWQSSGFFKEFLTSVLTGLLGMPGGVLLFIPLYHPLHDFGKIHSEVTFFILFVVFLTISWTGDRTARKTIYQKISSIDYMLLVHLFIHYSLFLSLTIWGSPENEVAIGLHEPVGPCESRVQIQTAFGSLLEKREFLCVTDYDEDYFDFHCLPGGKPPKHGSIWYTACGKPFRNRTEYIAVISIICFLAAMIFYNSYFNSPAGCKKPEKYVTSFSKQKKIQ